MDQKLDSIQVKNLTRPLDTTLIGVETLVLSPVTTGVDDATLRSPDRLEVSNNFENPFLEKTYFHVTIPGASMLTLEVFNALGQSLVRRNLAYTS